MTLRKLLPCSGIALVVLIAVSVVLGGSTPGSTAHGAEVAAYYDSHQARMFLISFVFGLAALAAVVFAATLARSLRSADDDTAIWDRVLVGGSVMFASSLGFVAAANLALADSPKKISDPALQAVNLLLNDSWVFWNSALGVFMLGAAGMCLISTAGYRWFGRIAIVLGVALFIPWADFFALLASGLWIVAMTVTLTRRGQAPAYQRTAAAAT